jgi:hypothetical protein
MVPLQPIPFNDAIMMSYVGEANGVEVSMHVAFAQIEPVEIGTSVCIIQTYITLLTQTMLSYEKQNPEASTLEQGTYHDTGSCQKEKRSQEYNEVSVSSVLRCCNIMNDSLHCNLLSSWHATFQNKDYNCLLLLSYAQVMRLQAMTIAQCDEAILSYKKRSNRLGYKCSITRGCPAFGIIIGK